MSKSLKATLPAVLAVAAAFASAYSFAQGKGEKVTIVGPLPLPVTGTVSGAVTITNQPNVFVTNSTANPVPTQDAYPRTPFKTQVRENTSHEVPTGVRLVVETTTASVQCQFDVGASAAFAVGNVVTAAATGLRAVSVPLTRGPALNFDGTISARIVLEPGEKFVPTGGCNAGATASLNFFLFGYTISVNSPSLAP